MAKKKEFFSTFDKNLSIKEEVAVVNKQAPEVVKTASIATAAQATTEVAEQSAPAPATPVINETAPVATTPIKKLVKKKPATVPAAKIDKNANLAKPTTFRIDVALMEDIKAVAYWERQKIQDVLDNALRTYISEIPKQELARAKKAYSSAN